MNIRRVYHTFYIMLALPLFLGACDVLESSEPVNIKEESRAIGAACRQSGSSLESCYGKYPKADKAAIFAGWREMQEYMKKNALETMPTPQKPQEKIQSPDLKNSPTDSPADASAPKGSKTLPPLGTSSDAQQKNNLRDVINEVNREGYDG